MRIFICDDDASIVKQLQNYLREFFDHRSLQQPEYVCFSNGEELLMMDDMADIVFLDVEMPGKSGIEIGKEIKKRKRNCLIFIVTSYGQYLDDAMEFRVFRYLSKPIDKARLYRNMNQAILHYRSSNRKIRLETKDGVQVRNEMDIVCVEACSKKIFVYTLDEKIQVFQKMSFWAEQLHSGCFFQTHRSYIVNMKYVTSYDDSLVHLLGDKVQAYLTRRKYKEFKERHFLYLEKMR